MSTIIGHYIKMSKPHVYMRRINTCRACTADILEQQQQQWQQRHVFMKTRLSVASHCKKEYVVYANKGNSCARILPDLGE